MEILELTAKNFEPFGRILTDADVRPVGASKEFDWYDTAGGIPMNETCCTGLLSCRPRERRVVKMERHLCTSEVLFPLDGNSVLVVAPPEDSLGSVSGVKAFRLPVGTSVVMKVGTWHWIPFPEGKEDVRILVLFRDGTGADDLDFKELPEAIHV